MKINFDKHYVIAMHVELAAARKRVHKLSRVRELVAFYKVAQMNYLRLLEKTAAWRTTSGFDRSEILLRDRSGPRGMCIPKSIYIWPATVSCTSIIHRECVGRG